MMIVEAALNEFACQGFEKASTNSIIKAAGVSKGLLFHYFKNKKQLFLYVVDEVLEYIFSYFDERLKEIPRNIIDGIIKANMMKIEFAAAHPMKQKFLSEAFLDPPEEIKEDIKIREKKMQDRYMPYVTGEVDKGAFREGVDPKRAVELVMIVVNALAEKYIKGFMQSKDKDGSFLIDFVGELESYLGLLKYGIYK